MMDERQETRGERGGVKMYRKKLLQSKRCGFAMALVLCAIVILLITGSGLLRLGLHSRTFGARTCSGITARCAADAALTKAVFDMNQKLFASAWDSNTLPHVTDEPLTNSDATFSYTVTGDLGNNSFVECIGSSGQATKTVNAFLRLQGLFDNAITAKNTITLKTGTIVDGYDSSNPGAEDVPVKIATSSTDEGSISLSPGVSVDGDMLLGIDAYYPDVTPPILQDMGTGISVQGESVTLSPEDSGKYTGIMLKKSGDPNTEGSGANLVIAGGDVVLHVTGDMWFGQGTELIIEQNSSVTIYLDGNFTAGNSSGINNETQDATSFILYGTGENQRFELKAKCDWFGAIYAPDAKISIKAGANIHGAFVSADFEFQGGGYIYYDAALRNVSTTDIGVTFVIERWQEE